MKKIAFLPDAHRPYHDKQAWGLFMKSMQEWKPDILVCLGDLADCYKVSSFSKDPTREFSFKEEIDDVLVGLDDLDSLGATRKIFIGGNHEDRLVRYLQLRAPELFEFIDIPKLFELNRRGWEYVPYKSAIQVGKLWITHDVGVAGRYSVFRAADTFQHPVVMAHTHRLVYIVEGNATGETFPAVQFGWMGDVEKIDYQHKVAAKRSHCLAFGTGLLDEDTGWIYLQPHPIVNGTVVVDGKRFT
jgi:predicted phosphodiesterase